MKTSMDFGQGTLLAFWNSMTEDERREMIANLTEFHALISSLAGRKIITTDKHLSEIVINRKTKETDELVLLRDKTNAQGIKITYKGKEINPPPTVKHKKAQTSHYCK
jgi:adenylate cyclase class IV